MIEGTTAYAVKLHPYKKGEYLGIPIPSELGDLGIDTDINLYWNFVSDDPSYLEAYPTEKNEDRYHLSIQPRSGRRLATVKKEFMNREDSPVYGLESGDPVWLEVNLDERDVHLRVYDFDAYQVRQQEREPDLRLPAFAVGSIAYEDVFEAFERFLENREYKISCETSNGDKVIVDRAVVKRVGAPEGAEQIQYDDCEFVFSAIAGEWYTVKLDSEEYGSKEKEIWTLEDVGKPHHDRFFFGE